ncbi:cytochrome P450 [Bacillus norwichensis]|uniref:Cytochrome P450 n=1 Tax=Bacillus norwichensis TaxID=2762217 RepID=A0ABR8VN01_9BACI|nr:cytochrome P450 [Bacillus norwichensis]MBD8006154.1 cytochrome P450 [Bacillus norwichensis]
MILNPYLKKGKNQNKIAEWYQGIANFITSFNQTKEEQEYSFWCSEQLEKYLLPIIEERKNSRHLDLISLLHQSETTDTKMTSQEILALTLNILLAATEPVDKTLALLFYHLLENPDQFAKVEKDRKLLKNGIREKHLDLNLQSNLYRDNLLITRKLETFLCLKML